MTLPKYLLLLPMVLVFPIGVPAQITPVDKPLSPNVLSKHVRDPQALLVLQKSLQALGGEAALNSFQSAKLNQTVESALTAVPAATVHIEYDWTGDVLRLKSEAITNGKHSIRFSTPEKGVHIQSNGQLRDLTNRVAARSLPSELPAVAFLIAINEPEYSVQFMPSASPDIQVIRVIRFKNGVALLESSQDWYISSKSSLPDHLTLYAANQNYKPALVPTAMMFASYQTVGSLLIPLRMLTSTASGNARTLTITSATMNNSASPADFEPVGATE